MAAPALLALLLAAAQPYAKGDSPWLCQRVHEHPTGSLWIALSADDRGRPVSESLYWNVIESGRAKFQAHWQYRDAGARRPAPESLWGDIPLSAPPERPVRVRMTVDGKVRPGRPGSPRLRTYRGQAVLGFAFGSDDLPDIRGRKSLTFVAVEDGGRELGSLTIELPSWKLVYRQVDRARRELAYAGRRKIAPCQRRDDRIYD